MQTAAASRAGRVVTIALTFVLAAAVGAQFLHRTTTLPTSTPHRRLAEATPRELRGWQVTDLPLGPTEAVNEAALKTLNLDDYVYREFKRGAESFTIYAAYWAAGKMPARLVASHTPDRCWTENGMRCTDMRFRQDYAIGERSLLPAEYRAFLPAGGGERIHVAYWHVVGGESYDYGARFNAVPSPWRWWKDTLSEAAYGSREQLFVRVASTQPIDALWRQPDFLNAMRVFADLGLWAKAP
jgi:hypothetical protein